MKRGITSSRSERAATPDMEPRERPMMSRREMATTLAAAIAGTTLTGCEPTGGSAAEVGRVARIMSSTAPAVETIAELRGVVGSSGGSMWIVVRHYATEGDQGGGLFVWAHEGAIPHDDGGTIIVPPGQNDGYWQRLYSGPLLVSWFGGSLPAAVTAAAAVAEVDGSAMVALTAPCSLASDLVVPAAVQLLVTAGGRVEVNDGNRLTVQGPFEAPMAKVFSGHVVLGESTPVAYVDWWGNDSRAFEGALASTRKRVHFTQGRTYSIAKVELPPVSGLEIDGNWATVAVDENGGPPSYVMRLSWHEKDNFVSAVTVRRFFFSGLVTEGIVKIQGGPFTHCRFTDFEMLPRPAVGVVTGPSIIRFENDGPNNPAFLTVRNISSQAYDYKYVFHYSVRDTSLGFDNSTFENLRHLCSVPGGAAVHIEGPHATYSTFKNVYCAGYADGIAVIRTTDLTASGGAAVVRSTIRHAYLEGDGPNKACLVGYFSECDIDEVCHLVKAAVRGSATIVAKLDDCRVRHVILQHEVLREDGSVEQRYHGSGISLDLSSEPNTGCARCDLTNSESDANVVMSANGLRTLATLRPEELCNRDVVCIDVHGASVGASAKLLQLFEQEDRAIGSVGYLGAEDFSATLTYKVYVSGGSKWVSCHVRAYKGTTMVLNGCVPDRAFGSAIRVGLYAAAQDGSWPGNAIMIKMVRVSFP